jgi:hypothetical protein
MKASASGYDEAPFFYVAHGEARAPIIAWDSNADRQHAILFALLDEMGDRIEYVYEGWGAHQFVGPRIVGGILKRGLEALIEAFRGWFFADGSFQFYLREPDAAAFVLYDEHGLFFVYGRDDRQVLTTLSLRAEQRPLIYDLEHFHVRPPGAEHFRQEFESALKEASAFFDDREA